MQKGHCPIYNCTLSRAAVVHLNFRAGSIFPIPVCIVPSSWTGLASATRLTLSDICFIKVEFTFTKGADLRVFGCLSIKYLLKLLELLQNLCLLRIVWSQHIRARTLKEYRWTKLDSSFLFGVFTFCRFWFRRIDKNEEYEETK